MRVQAAVPGIYKHIQVFYVNEIEDNSTTKLLLLPVDEVVCLSNDVVRACRFGLQRLSLCTFDLKIAK